MAKIGGQQGQLPFGILSRPVHRTRVLVANRWRMSCNRGPWLSATPGNLTFEHSAGEACRGTRRVLPNLAPRIGAGVRHPVAKLFGSRPGRVLPHPDPAVRPGGNPLVGGTGSRLNDSGKEILMLLAQELGKLPNSVSIEGHTD